MEIVLVRHGKPFCDADIKVDANGFEKWLRDYDKSRVDMTLSPPNVLTNICTNSYIISSTLPRAIHSVEIVINQKPNKQFSLLNEMPMPNFPFPFKMHITLWLFLNRILWFLGFSGNIESYKSSKQRASLMVTELHNILEENGSIVVFGHGLMNRQISKEFVRLGWKNKRQSKGFWGIEFLKKDQNG